MVGPLSRWVRSARFARARREQNGTFRNLATRKHGFFAGAAWVRFRRRRCEHDLVGAVTLPDGAAWVRFRRRRCSWIGPKAQRGFVFAGEGVAETNPRCAFGPIQL